MAKVTLDRNGEQVVILTKHIGYEAWIHGQQYAECFGPRLSESPGQAEEGEVTKLTVLDIVTEYLKANGFDGLGNEVCCCQNSDLAPCGEMEEGCEAGHKIPCDPETCSVGGGCEFHIGVKP